jgi:type 9 secretion system plug protein
MIFNKKYCLLFLLFSLTVFSQVEKEANPPFNIKTVAFVQNGNITIPMFRLGDPFQLEFDDLYGNEADYYYTITQYNYDWTPSQMAKAEYLQGMDNQRIMNYQNSFNTLQIYSHYSQAFPNQFNRILLTGNYMVKVFNSDQELVFSRKFIIFNEQVSVPLQIKRSRDLTTIHGMQNLDFVIKMGDNILQNPNQNVKVALFQNGRFDTAIYNVKPQYSLGSDLIYRYNKETQFWAGNEFLYFENKDIRTVSNSIGHVSAGEIYNTHLYMNASRKDNPYTYFPDINGGFLPNKINAENNNLEADYSWVYFTLNTNTFMDKNDVYVVGMFNNYSLSPEYKMDYNPEKGLFEKAILVKQGFTNYQYAIADKTGKIDSENAIDGNFYQTENNYFVLVYYRGNNDRYDKVIGRGIATSEGITN